MRNRFERHQTRNDEHRCFIETQGIEFSVNFVRELTTTCLNVQEIHSLLDAKPETKGQLTTGQSKALFAKSVADAQQNDSSDPRGICWSWWYTGSCKSPDTCPYEHIEQHETYMVMGFGMYRERRLHKVPVGYLRWMKRFRVHEKRGLAFAHEMRRVWPDIFT